MKLVLDTSIIIDIERKYTPTITALQQLGAVSPEQPAISFMTYFELLYGLQRKPIKNHATYLASIQQYLFLRPTQKTAQILADLKFRLDREGNTFTLTDLFIVSQVKEVNGMLVTKDKQFQTIREIRTMVL